MEKQQKSGKGKDKGDGAVNANDKEEQDAEGKGNWEDKVAVLCTVRANAKIRSFSLGRGEGLKGQVPVSVALRLWIRARSLYGSHSFCHSFCLLVANRNIFD